MANGDDSPYSGSYFDQSFGSLGDQTPVGTTTAIGATAQNPNDPLIDWASNLKKDDLANFLHNPQKQAAQWAADGVGPPDPEAVHNANDIAQTPSRSERFMVAPQAQDALSEPMVRVDPRTGRIIGNISDARSAVGGAGGLPQGASQFAPGDQPPPRPEDTAGTPSQRRPVPQTRTIGPSGGLVADSGAPQDERATTPPIVEDIKRRAREFGTDTGTGREGGVPARPRVPITGGTTEPPPATNVYVSPGAGSINPFDPKFVGPPVPAPPVPPPPPAPTPIGGGEGKEPETPEKVREKKMQEAGKAISELGKAMQGVKAPEPLKPPGFAPSPGRPSALSPQIMQLLQARQGTTPPSALPSLLRMLGR